MTAVSGTLGAETVHHDPPEVVTGRQVLGVWLFIAGDAVIVGSILFTYMYLRGLNTVQQWMPRGVHGASDVLAWGIVLAAACSLAVFVAAERATGRGSNGAVGMALLAVVLVLAGVVLCVLAIRHVPQAVNPTSQIRQIDGSYASSILAINVSNLLHLAVLAFLGVAIAVRTAKGRITAANPTHTRLVRIFWAWVVVSMAVAALMTTVFVASPK
jgi:heme/copper-type cytochrome/quinol oxidase subunit 3